MQLPWPFVTQGSQPIHVYDSVDYINHCFSNYGSGYSIDNYVYLKDYGVDYPTVKTGYLLSLLTRTVELEITIPDSGFAFIRQHLDDGIKGWSLDFNGDGIIDMIDYGKDNANNAADPATGRVLVPNLFEHPFYMWGFKCSADDPACDITPPSSDIAIEGGTSITNQNDFQKNVGVGGLVLYNAVPVPGMTVQLLYMPNRNVCSENKWVRRGKSHVLPHITRSGVEVGLAVTRIQPSANSTASASAVSRFRS